MSNHSFSFKTAKFFGRKSSGSAKRKPDELSVKGSALISHEIPEIVVVTEISRGLGRRVPFPSEETFAGIVNIQYVYDSARRRSACSGSKSSKNSNNSCKKEKSSGAVQHRDQEKSRPLENVETKAKSD